MGLACRRRRGQGRTVKVAREPALAMRRAIVAGVSGCVAASVALQVGASWSLSALYGFDVAAVVFMVWVWVSVAGADAARTQYLARAEDASPTAAEGVLIGAGAASLVAVGFTLAAAGDAAAPARGLLTALAFASVALAWTAVHTVWALRYARLYYSSPEGGIDFGGDDPEYADFAYLALTIGMTFQVSDTALANRRIRRAALHHALLSYLFGTVIVAITVSTVARLLT
jgi:uncharacterized membrane protein